MTLFEVYLWIAASLGVVFAAVWIGLSIAIAVMRRQLRRMARPLVIDLTPFIPAGALRRRPPAN